ncbi:MAG TPA: hypothetical protein VG519_02700 [Pseudochrobactrum sp.]|nr:hypothetical protein [Pseudochrobactrum sp.]
MPTDEPEALYSSQWIYPQGSNLKSLVGPLVARVESSIASGSLSSRKPRSDGIKARRIAAESITANIAHMVCSPDYIEGQRLIVSTAKTAKTRYHRPQYPQNQIGLVVDQMETHGFIIKHDYEFQKRSTTIEPTSKLKAAISRHNIQPLDVGRYDGEETIWLYARNPERQAYGINSPKILVSYEDTRRTAQYRKQMNIINRFLNTACITFNAQPLTPFALRRVFLLRSSTDAPKFHLGGRLGGGIWMNLPSGERWKLAINGEPLADLDFTGMFIQLAYLKAGLELPEDDPYIIEGLEAYRSGIKQALLVLLSRSGPMRLLKADLKELLPNGWTYRDVVAILEKRHPAIAHMFGSDRGIDLMFTESQMLVALLVRLAELGIPALPLHDGLMVRQSHKEATIQAMYEVSKQQVGASLPVKEKPIAGMMCAG